MVTLRLRIAADWRSQACRAYGLRPDDDTSESRDWERSETWDESGVDSTEVLLPSEF